MSTNKIVANALKAKNGAYDTLIIRKDSKYGNLWCIYQDGSTNRAVPRVFESPDAAKKYIKEKMPAWGDAKIKVKNSIATNADNRPETASFGNNDVKCEIADYGKGPGFHISVYTDGLSSPGSWGDKGKKCINDAKTVLKAFERKASALKQAIAWMEQNAKKW